LQYEESVSDVVHPQSRPAKTVSVQALSVRKTGLQFFGILIPVFALSRLEALAESLRCACGYNRLRHHFALHPGPAMRNPDAMVVFDSSFTENLVSHYRFLKF
jgi:hypothetical protein